MSFWDSQVVKDFENGKLPPVEVTISTETIITICFWALLTVIMVIMLQRIFS